MLRALGEGLGRIASSGGNGDVAHGGVTVKSCSLFCSWRTDPGVQVHGHNLHRSSAHLFQAWFPKDI